MELFLLFQQNMFLKRFILSNLFSSSIVSKSKSFAIIMKDIYGHCLFIKRISSRFKTY